MRQNRSTLFLGVLLILLGAWLVVSRQVPSVREWLDQNFAWPMWTIGAGLLIFLIGLIASVTFPALLLPRPLSDPLARGTRLVTTLLARTRTTATSRSKRTRS